MQSDTTHLELGRHRTRLTIAADGRARSGVVAAPEIRTQRVVEPLIQAAALAGVKVRLCGLGADLSEDAMRHVHDRFRTYGDLYHLPEMMTWLVRERADGPAGRPELLVVEDAQRAFGFAPGTWEQVVEDGADSGLAVIAIARSLDKDQFGGSERLRSLLLDETCVHFGAEPEGRTGRVGGVLLNLAQERLGELDDTAGLVFEGRTPNGGLWRL
jgi:hypothetical protein